MDFAEGQKEPRHIAIMVPATTTWNDTCSHGHDDACDMERACCSFMEDMAAEELPPSIRSQCFYPSWAWREVRMLIMSQNWRRKYCTTHTNSGMKAITIALSNTVDWLGTTTFESEKLRLNLRLWPWIAEHRVWWGRRPQRSRLCAMGLCWNVID